MYVSVICRLMAKAFCLQMAAPAKMQKQIKRLERRLLESLLVYSIISFLLKGKKKKKTLRETLQQRNTRIENLWKHAVPTFNAYTYCIEQHFEIAQRGKYMFRCFLNMFYLRFLTFCNKKERRMQLWSLSWIILLENFISRASKLGCILNNIKGFCLLPRKQINFEISPECQKHMAKP